MKRKYKFLNRVLSLLLIMSLFMGLTPINVKADEKMTPNQFYTVNIDVSDKILEIYSYIHRRALVKADENGKMTMKVFMFTDWKGNHIKDFSLYKDSKKNKNNMVSFKIKDIKADLAINQISKKSATGLVTIGNIKREISEVDGRYKLNTGLEDDFKMTIDWKSLKIGNNEGVEVPEDKDLQNLDLEVDKKEGDKSKEEQPKSKKEDNKTKKESQDDIKNAPFKVLPESRDLKEKTPLKFEYDKTGKKSIYYTVNGKDPLKHWSTKEYPHQEYTIEGPTIVKAMLVDKDKPESERYGKIYTIKYSFNGKQADDKAEDGSLNGNVFTKGSIKRGEDYDTITLQTNSKRFYDGTVDVKKYGDTARKVLSTDEYYIDLYQGDGENKKTEHTVFNAGIGGFIATFDEEKNEGQVIINLKKNTFDEKKKLKARVVLKDSKDILLEMDLSKKDNIIEKVEEKSQKELKEEKIIPLGEMEKNKVYTGSFDAVRYDDESRESMLAGFFDKSVKLEVSDKGEITATFYNTVFADSMIDFAICSDDGSWVFTSKDGEKKEEKSERGQTIAATYKIKIPDPSKNKSLIGAVNVLAMGGSDKNNGNHELYTKVKMKFRPEVKEGFTDFETRANRLPQHKIINRALLTVNGLDSNKDGFVSDKELKEFDFKDELNLSRDRLFSRYNIHDNFDLSDISFLKKIGKKSNIKTINFNDLRITNVNDEFYGYNNLERLIMSANVIMDIKDNAFKDLSKLKELRLSKNMLQTINKNTFRGIKSLSGGYGDGGYYNGNFDISNNRISKIEEGSFTNFSSINGYDFSLNELENFDASKVFRGVTDKVKTLSLGNNKLTQAPMNLQALKNMDFLSLSSNNLYKTGNSYDNLKNLKTLYLNDNRIENISDSMISTNKLDKLYLAKNSITNLPESMISLMAKGHSGFDTIFENNCLDENKIDFKSVDEKAASLIKNKIKANPQKSLFNAKVSAQEGKINFKTDISALDYYIYARVKGYLADKDAKEKLKKILGKETIETAEDLIKFRNQDLPDLSMDKVKNSILTSSLGTTDSLIIKTSIEKFGGGKFYTLKEWEDLQDASTKRGTIEGSFIDHNAIDGGLYRILFSVKSAVDDKRNQTYAVYIKNKGNSSEEDSEDTVNKDDKNRKDNKDSGKVSDKVDTSIIDMLRKGTLQDGKYSVDIRMKKAADPERKQLSMADNSAERTVLIEVKNNEATIYTRFRGMEVELSKGKSIYGFLGKLKYYEKGYDYNNMGMPQGYLNDAKVISVHKKNGELFYDRYNEGGEGYPYEVSFPLVDIKRAFRDKYIPLHVFVPVMESIARNTGDQDVLMEFNWDSIKRIDKDSSISDIAKRDNMDRKKTEDENNTFDFEDRYEESNNSSSKSDGSFSLNEDYPSLRASSTDYVDSKDGSADGITDTIAEGNSDSLTEENSENPEALEELKDESSDSSKDSSKKKDKKSNNKKTEKNSSMKKGLLGFIGAVAAYILSAAGVFIYNKKIM